MQPAPSPDYSTITELPEQGATRLQLAMLRTRYAWAASHALGKDVAEIACGAGLGLGWIARTARSVEAGDLHPANCRAALATYAGRENIRVRPMDALHLPFPDASFDVLVLFEAVYYLHAGKFLGEAARVLRRGGTLLLSTVNCQWSGFNPSPFHTRYLPAVELKDALRRAGFAAELEAGFPEGRSARDGVARKVRRLAVAARMIPATMAGKAFLKRMFYGSLEPIPRELEPGPDPDHKLTPITPGMDLTSYRTLYAEARKLS
jgi:SAM-dependent methyltransferase